MTLLKVKELGVKTCSKLASLDTDQTGEKLILFNGPVNSLYSGNPKNEYFIKK